MTPFVCRSPKVMRNNRRSQILFARLLRVYPASNMFCGSWKLEPKSWKFPRPEAIRLKRVKISVAQGSRATIRLYPIDRALSATPALHVVQPDVRHFLLLRLCRSFTAHQKRYTNVLKCRTRLATLDVLYSHNMQAEMQTTVR
jgi:hypothetical protein